MEKKLGAAIAFILLLLGSIWGNVKPNPEPPTPTPTATATATPEPSPSPSATVVPSPSPLPTAFPTPPPATPNPTVEDPCTLPISNGVCTWPPEGDSQFEDIVKWAQIQAKENGFLTPGGKVK